MFSIGISVNNAIFSKWQLKVNKSIRVWSRKKYMVVMKHESHIFINTITWIIMEFYLMILILLQSSKIRLNLLQCKYSVKSSTKKFNTIILRSINKYCCEIIVHNKVRILFKLLFYVINKYISLIYICSQNKNMVNIKIRCHIFKNLIIWIMEENTLQY